MVKQEAREFVWDRANTDKNWLKHQVKPQEAEEPFFDQQRKEFSDKKHSAQEERFILVGQTKAGRILYVAYTLRKNKIRVISARDLNRRERSIYEKAITNSKI